MSYKQQLLPVLPEKTQEYISRMNNYFKINEEIQPNFYSALKYLCQHPEEINKISSKDLQINGQKYARFCAFVVDGPVNLNISYTFYEVDFADKKAQCYYRTRNFHSVTSLVKFLALQILLSENGIREFPM